MTYTSTINPLIPVSGTPMSSADMRAQFAAAINDVNALNVRVDRNAGARINILDYGVTTASTDNATALQNAINAAVSANLPLYIPASAAGYKYTPSLTIGGNLTIIGDGVWGAWGANSVNIPQGSPALVGSVLRPLSNGNDAIVLTGEAYQLNIENLGLEFQTRWTGTGNGISYIPSSSKQGLSGSLWKNVYVFGHGGSKYAFTLQNPIYNTFVHCQSFGGGGWNLYGTSGGYHYGNSVWLHPYVQTFVGGTSHAYNLDAGGAVCLNLLTFVRPQGMVVTWASATGSAPGGPGGDPTSSQRTWMQTTNVQGVSITAPDFETSVSSKPQFHVNSQCSVDFNCLQIAGASGYDLAAVPNKVGKLNNGTIVMGNSVGGSTSGSVTFDYAFPNACWAVVCTPWGSHATALNGAPTTTGFTYTQSGAGTFYYMAFGY